MTLTTVSKAADYCAAPTPPLPACAVVSTTIRRPFDGHSTAYQRSLRSQWRNRPTAITLSYLFISAAVQRPGRNVGRQVVVARWNCSRMGVERRSNRNCKYRLSRRREAITDAAASSIEVEWMNRNGDAVVWRCVSRHCSRGFDATYH